MWPAGEGLQEQLARCRAQADHWQGVATICELSKQEELAELQKQCDQEIQSLQEALRGLSVCLSVCLSVTHLSVLTSVPLSVCLSVCPSDCLPVPLSVCLSVCLSVRPSHPLSVRPPSHPI